MEFFELKFDESFLSPTEEDHPMGKKITRDDGGTVIKDCHATGKSSLKQKLQLRREL